MKSKIKILIVVVGAYPDVGKGVLTASIGYLFKKCGLIVGIIKFDGYFNINSGNMNPYHKFPKQVYSEEEIFVLKDGYQADADHGYYERFLDLELSGETCLTNGYLLNELLEKIKSREYKFGQILKYKNLRDLMKQKIRSLMIDKDILILEVGGTIGDEESLQLYKSLNEMMGEKAINIHIIMVSPYLSDGNGNKNIELSSRTKVTRKAFVEALSLGLKPNIVVLRNKCEVRKNDIEYIANDCNISKKSIFLDPQLSNIYELPESLEKQGIIDYFISNKNRTIGRIESYNRAKDKLKDSPIIKIGLFGKTISYDTFISLKEACEHAAIYVGRKIELIWIDDLLKEKLEIPWIKIKGLIIAEGMCFIKEKLEAIKSFRKANKPLLAISFGADLLVKEYVEDEQNKKVAIEELGENFKFKIYKTNLEVGEKEVFFSKDSITNEIYEKTFSFERMRHCSWASEQLIKNLGNNFIVSGITSDKKPCIFEDKTKKFCIGVKFHPEYKSRPGMPHPLFVKFLEILKKKEVGSKVQK